MKKLPTLATLLLFTTICYSQSLFDKLDGAETDFIFTTNSKEMTVKSQAIISKGITYETWDSEPNRGYGYGYRGYHIEFMIKEDISTVDSIVNRPIPEFTEISFFDKSNNLFLKTNLGLAQFKDLTGRIVYLINVNAIPMTLLNDTKRIDIKKVRTRVHSNNELKELRKERKESRKIRKEERQEKLNSSNKGNIIIIK